MSNSEEEKEVASPSLEDRQKARQSFAGIMRIRSARGATFMPAAVPDDDLAKRMSLPRKRSQRDGFDV